MSLTQPTGCCPTRNCSARWPLAHRAIGFRYGITHTEVKLTGRGPVIVEINGRLAGDLVPMLPGTRPGSSPAP